MLLISSEESRIDQLKTELKCSKKSFKTIAKIFLISSLPTIFDSGSDTFNAYTFLTGATYKKTVGNHTDESITPNYMNSVKNCTWIGETQNYVVSDDFTRLVEKDYDYEFLKSIKFGVY